MSNGLMVLIWEWKWISL